MAADIPAEGRITVDVAGPAAWITIDNPRKRNAMSVAMWRRIPEAVAEAAAGPAVRSIVLTGAGGTFSSGADISEFTPEPDGGADEEQVSVAAERALLACPLPTIAAVEGHCVGGGYQLAAACDVRLCAPGAQFGITPAKLGIVYPPTSVQRLTDVVGPSAAKLLLFSGEIVDARRAVELRLVDEVADPVRKRAAALTETIASRSRLTVAASKELVDAAVTGDALEPLARRWRTLATTTGERAEGVRAFHERRPPVFPY
ncbi:enoyl-CoA hydratase/isomerase family protein [Nocardiopsis coralliicola]